MGIKYDISDFALSGMGVTLRKINKNDLEKVRKWRNLDRIRLQFANSRLISANSQLNWFESISERSLYLMIVYKNEELGVASLIISKDGCRAESAGVYVGVEKYMSSDISFRSMLLLYDYAFMDLKLEKVTIIVLSSNKKAIRFNKIFGFVMVNNIAIEGRDFIVMELFKDNYFESVKQFRRIYL